jgi:hypothetical protein
MKNLKNGLISTFFLIMLLFVFIIQANAGGLYPDYSEADQGVPSGKTIKGFLDTIGIQTKATIYLRHNSNAQFTDYIFSTDIAIPANIDFQFENGARLVIASGKNCIFYSPSEINAHSNQQIFSGSGNIRFVNTAGSIYPGWWGAKGDGVTDDTSAFKSAITCSLKSLDGYGGGLVLEVPAGRYIVSSVLDLSTLGDSAQFCVIKGSGMYKTFFLWTGLAHCIKTGSRSQFEDFTILGTNSTGSQTGILITGSNNIFNNVRARLLATGFLLQDAYINRFNSCNIYGCANGLVTNGSQINTGFGLGTTPCQDNTFSGCSFNANTYALRLNGCRSAQFIGCNIELNTYGIVFEGQASINNRFEGIWLENAFYALWFNITGTGSVSYNNIFENLYVAGFNNMEFLPSDKTLADARHIYLQSTSGGLRNTVIRNCFFVTVSGAKMAYGVEGAGGTFQSLTFENNYMSPAASTGNLGIVMDISLHSK